MNLPVIDLFTPPYEQWSTRAPTLDEANSQGNHSAINDKLLASCKNAVEAATHAILNYSDNGLGNHIEGTLDESPAFKVWRQAMPSITPANIAQYQKEYEKCDFDLVSSEIDSNGTLLPDGQFIFHGGLWPGDITTTRPLSTSMCPNVAISNALHKGKAFPHGRLDLIVFRVCEPSTNAFIFKKNGTTMGHEKEALFASGANIKKTNETLVCSKFSDRGILAYVVEATIS